MKYSQLQPIVGANDDAEEKKFDLAIGRVFQDVDDIRGKHYLNTSITNYYKIEEEQDKEEKKMSIAPSSTRSPRTEKILQKRASQYILKIICDIPRGSARYHGMGWAEHIGRKIQSYCAGYTYNSLFYLANPMMSISLPIEIDAAQLISTGRICSQRVGKHDITWDYSSNNIDGSLGADIEGDQGEWSDHLNSVRFRGRSIENLQRIIVAYDAGEATRPELLFGMQMNQEMNRGFLSTLIRIERGDESKANHANEREFTMRPMVHTVGAVAFSGEPRLALPRGEFDIFDHHPATDVIAGTPLLFVSASVCVFILHNFLCFNLNPSVYTDQTLAITQCKRQHRLLKEEYSEDGEKQLRLLNLHLAIEGLDQEIMIDKKMAFPYRRGGSTLPGISNIKFIEEDSKTGEGRWETPNQHLMIVSVGNPVGDSARMMEFDIERAGKNSQDIWMVQDEEVGVVSKIRGHLFVGKLPEKRESDILNKPIRIHEINGKLLCAEMIEFDAVALAHIMVTNGLEDPPTGQGIAINLNDFLDSNGAVRVIEFLGQRSTDFNQYSEGRVFEYEIQLSGHKGKVLVPAVIWMGHDCRSGKIMVPRRCRGFYPYIAHHINSVELRNNKNRRFILETVKRMSVLRWSRKLLNGSGGTVGKLNRRQIGVRWVKAFERSLNTRWVSLRELETYVGRYSV